MAGRKDTEKIRIIAIYLMMARGRKMSTRDILRELELKYDIVVSRKTIYKDMLAIDRFIPIQTITGPHGGYQKLNFEELI